ncbi:MAG: TonB family protein [Hyphomicrobium sp.]
MSAAPIEATTDLIGAAGEFRALAGRTPERNFWIALAVASLLHGSVFLSALSAKSKRLGEANGADDAINVSLVTEADFLSRTTKPEKLDSAPGAPAPPVQPQKPPPQQAAPELKKTERPETPPATNSPETKPDPEPPREAAAPIDTLAPDLFSIPDLATAKKKSEPVKPAASPAKPAQKPPANPAQQKTAKLDLTPPSPSYDAPPGAAGRSAGFSRPPGITRSGANDDFARAVIRALQQTMPQLRNSSGRVTVRIFLTENGNIKEVEVTRPSADSNLNQSVVFAARQTSYPFPPNGSNVADRTFLVTYIYN